MTGRPLRTGGFVAITGSEVNLRWRVPMVGWNLGTDTGSLTVRDEPNPGVRGGPCVTSSDPYPYVRPRRVRRVHKKLKCSGQGTPPWRWGSPSPPHTLCGGTRVGGEDNNLRRSYSRGGLWGGRGGGGAGRREKGGGRRDGGQMTPSRRHP